MAPKIKIRTKRNCKESLGEVDIKNRTVFVCGASKSERPHIIKHEKAHIEFNDKLISSPKKVQKYSNAVLQSPALSDDLESRPRNTPQQKGDYIDEYFAQTKEIQSRIKKGNTNLNSIEFKKAKRNLSFLE